MPFLLHIFQKFNATMADKELDNFVQKFKKTLASRTWYVIRKWPPRFLAREKRNRNRPRILIPFFSNGWKCPPPWESGWARTIFHFLKFSLHITAQWLLYLCKNSQTQTHQYFNHASAPLTPYMHNSCVSH